MAEASRPYWRTEEGWALLVRVTPNASGDRVDGVQVLADGQTVLRVKVRAVPENGRANKAVVALLAKRLKLSKSHLHLMRGETARLKTIAIRDVADDVAAALDALCD